MLHGMLMEARKHSLMITGFVFVMMLAIEYLNVLTRGAWDKHLRRHRWGQSIIGAALGTLPGCLGSFAAVSLYTHRALTVGALVATMIATSGDEAFVMLAMFPRQAMILFVVLFVVGAIVGTGIDIVLRSRRTAVDPSIEEHPSVHEDEDRCVCFSIRELFSQWRHCSAQRAMLTFMLMVFTIGVSTGDIGHSHFMAEPGEGEHAGAVTAPHDGEPLPEIGIHRHAVEETGAALNEASPESRHAGEGWGWVRITMLFAGLIGLMIVSTVPDHFLNSHLWEHLVKDHIWKVFLWTLSALVVMHMLIDRMELHDWIRGSGPSVLVIACLVGLVPQSGPHLIFVTLYANGSIPFSILLASSIVQDGHGMLPMLAHSRKEFFGIKAVNFAIGLAAGALGLAMGW